MKLLVNHYLDASRSRMETARRLHDQYRFSAAIYLAGVAIECLLRAYILRRDPAFDSRHDLSEMLKRSELADFVRAKDRIDVSAWLGTIWARWKNNYRYASDERLQSEFKRLAHDRGIKGNYLKENSSQVIEAAFQLRAIGERRWNSKTT
jgi:hypothetical protein